MKKGQNQTITRDLNLSLLMNAFIRRPMSRADISRKFKISKPAVSKITAELEQLNLIRSGKEEANFSVPGVKPLNFQINENLGIIIAVDLSTVEIKIQICDFSGSLLAQTKVPDMEIITFENIVYFCEEIDRLLSENSLLNKAILSLCVAIPCAVNKQNGAIDWSARFDIDLNFDLYGYLLARFNTNIIIKNDVQLYLMGEQEKGLLSDTIDYALLFYVDAGVGGSLFMEGKLYDGEQGKAGDFGYFPLKVDDKTLMLDSIISINAIKKAIEKRLKNGENSSLSSLKKIHFKDIQKAYLIDRDTLILDVVNSSATMAAKAFISLSQILNINSVIICGRIIRLGEEYLNVINENLSEYSTHKIEVKFSQIGETAILDGCVICSINEIVEQKILNRSQLSESQIP